MILKLCSCCFFLHTKHVGTSLFCVHLGPGYQVISLQTLNTDHKQYSRRSVTLPSGAGSCMEPREHSSPTPHPTCPPANLRERQITGHISKRYEERKSITGVRAQWFPSVLIAGTHIFTQINTRVRDMGCCLSHTS